MTVYFLIFVFIFSSFYTWGVSAVLTVVAAVADVCTDLGHVELALGVGADILCKLGIDGTNNADAVGKGQVLFHFLFLLSCLVPCCDYNIPH